MFAACPLLVYCLPTACLLHVQICPVSTSCLLRVYCMSSACLLHVYCVSTACPRLPCVYFMSTSCPLHVFCMSTTCASQLWTTNKYRWLMNHSTFHAVQHDHVRCVLFSFSTLQSGVWSQVWLITHPCLDSTAVDTIACSNVHSTWQYIAHSLTSVSQWSG